MATSKSTKAHKKPAKRTTKARTAKPAASSRSQSFKIVSSDTPFFTFAFTKESLYWLIFMGCVLALGMWVLYLQDQINQIYDQIDANNIQLELTADEYERLRKASQK